MANLKEQDKWEDGVYQIEENDPVLGGENGVTNRPLKQLANRTSWLKKALELLGKKSAPKDLTASSVSAVEANGHTHKLPIGTISEKGVVKLNSQVGNDSEQEAATPKAVKAAYDKGVEAKTAADAAQRTANDGVSKAKAAQTSADAAQRTANDGVSKANAAQTSANAAQRTADDGVSKANAAQKSADAAQHTANDGVSKANAAQKSADTAQRTANDGVSKANAAQLTANDGVSKANAAQRTANDGISKANAAQRSADNANTNANGRVSKSGDTINGNLRINGQDNNWSKIQFGANYGVWELEVHPDSHVSVNRRFNMKYNGDSTVFLAFPTIGDNGETVAYRSWVEDRTTLWSKIDGKPSFATRWPNAAEQGYSHSLGRTGWTKLPSGLIIQWGEVNGVGEHKFPIAFNSVGQVFVCERSYSDDGEIVVVRDVNNTSFRAWARRDMGAFLFFAIGS